MDLKQEKVEPPQGAGAPRRALKFRAWRQFGDAPGEMFPHDDSGSLFAHSLVYPDRYHLMQFTGLQDKNGRDIYEGDIIEANITEWSVPTMGEVRYSEEYQAFANFNEGGVTLLFKLSEFKVVGNIHESPDLVK